MSFFPTLVPGWCKGDELVHHFEVHLHSSDLEPSDLRAIRRAGGEYSDVRGYTSKRFVSVPPDAADVFERLKARATSGGKADYRLVIVRGPVEAFGSVHVRLTPKTTIESLLRIAERTAQAHGKPCSCCGRLIVQRSHEKRCAECHEERNVYERAKRAAEAAGQRYELAERCLWAANEGVMAIFEELSK